jgi:uncharacterized protein HemX
VGDTNIRTAQLISIIMILGAVGYLYVTRKILQAKYYHEILEENKEQIINTQEEKAL